ncbi:DNA helicase, UvrD type [Candidatus Mycoplasma haematolamae str. Purdue]|uniref:DNA 3'-5' helicase n=1 Tax=Mycoplasma haematolamae (strain Purdue) TaxID=1212765 RepID=I7C5I4_MYCHA|nr:ATP-dependent helicase [Candidatus Mycoplasma haematolamae]AFO51767.1 DNA helicase, UvrD type [Candidatus Mycoplasma haematolamae str. Purdue]
MTLSRQVPNQQQLDVIRFDEAKNVGIIAGPGSGKTFVIIEKIGFYLSKKIEPRKILLVTYTNRGIIEIRKRINKFVRAKKEFEYAGTIHSICKKFLEEELKEEFCKLLKFQINRIPIWEGKERFYFLQEEIRVQIDLQFGEASDELKLHIHEIVLEETENAISRNKIENYLNNDFQLKVMKYEWFSSRLSKKTERISFAKAGIIRVLKNVFEKYQSYLDKREMFDFDDLIIYFHYIVFNNPEKKKEIQSKFEKILVDEFQDMNFLQLLIISEISGGKKNIFFVGDPNQAIYGFQGAYPEIFSYFKTNIDISTIFFNLSQNYRSTKNILDLSHKLIVKNDQKDILNRMFTVNQSGEKIKWLVTDKQGGATKQIYSIIRNLEAQGVNLNQIAVISRTHMETKNLRKQFWSKGLKYLDYNYSKHIAWNYESYFLVCVFSLRFKTDPFAIKYILEFFFKREEIPDYFADQIEEYSDDLVLSLNRLTASNFEGRWTSKEDKKYIQKIKQLWYLLKQEIKQQKLREDRKSHFHVIVVNQESLEEYIKQNGTPELVKVVANQKYTAIKNIVHFYKIMTFYSGQTAFNLKEIFDLLLAYTKHFVSHVTEDNYLNFSTVHSAKGCEFDYVFILNLIEGRFPKHYAQTLQDIEEERRILFVGMTRAKKELYLVSDLYSHRARMKKVNPLTSRMPAVTSFLKELDFLEPNNQEISILNNLTNASLSSYSPN